MIPFVYKEEALFPVESTRYRGPQESIALISLEMSDRRHSTMSTRLSSGPPQDMNLTSPRNLPPFPLRQLMVLGMWSSDDVASPSMVI